MKLKLKSERNKWGTMCPVLINAETGEVIENVLDIRVDVQPTECRAIITVHNPEIDIELDEKNVEYKVESS